MRYALEQARCAWDENEVPIGAVVVNQQGEIIGRGYNQVEQKNSQAAHAEIIALSAAGKAMNGWRLNGCWLFVTLEPCFMCMGLAKLSRLAGVVFGAKSPLFGYQLDNDVSFQLYKNGAINIVGGICAEESAYLLKCFFQAKREKRVNDAKKSGGRVRDLEKIKRVLLERKQEFEEELARLYKEKFSDDQVQDPGDQAVSSTMELLRSSMQDTRLAEYNRIVKALEMIENGTYGICIDCHEPISEKRLKLFPNATRCLACQELFEESKE